MKHCLKLTSYIARLAIVVNNNARFMKYFFCYMPFGRKEEYAQEVGKANLERLAHLIKDSANVFFISTEITAENISIQY